MENLIIVDCYNNQIGTATKMEAHKECKLHRAFSVFLINDKNEMLIQKRAQNKYHSGGLWANSVCSHPRDKKDFFECVQERVEFEMGIKENLDYFEFDSFVYHQSFENGLHEFEYDIVLLAKYNGDVEPNTEEIEETKWVDLQSLAQDIAANPQNYACWFKIAACKVLAFLKENSL